MRLFDEEFWNKGNLAAADELMTANATIVLPGRGQVGLNDFKAFAASLRGAASRVGPGETAFALRDESYVMSIVAAWDGGIAGTAQWHIEWARACWEAMEPFSSSGVYVNFLGNEGEGRVRATYGVNYERLVALKNRYDPHNFFALNQNIKPTLKEVEPCLRQV